nr:hypothetical protein [Chitinophagaceae bacterium]
DDIKMNEALFTYKRKSHIEIGKIYFWTATINQWQQLLQEEAYKKVIINSLEYLSNAEKVNVFTFVIMPNHIHLIWKINAMNGKEQSQHSFLKNTAHEFKKMLRSDDENKLKMYAVVADNKKYEFWQRDSLAIPLYTKNIALQKLNYIHNNPLAERWQLAKDPCEYAFSSAKYYEMDIKEYAFLKDLRDEF